MALLAGDVLLGCARDLLCGSQCNVHRGLLWVMIQKSFCNRCRVLVCRVLLKVEGGSLWNVALLACDGM